MRILFTCITNLLNSRRVAFWLLFLMIAVLLFSASLPSPTKMSGDEWALLAEQNTRSYRLALRLSTPFLVTSWPFALLSVLLFLSTLICTVNRVALWWRVREADFSTERAFSVTVEQALAESVDDARLRFVSLMMKRGWVLCDAEPEKRQLTLQRGVNLGFWGSVVFHLGLLFCFVAPCVTALTGFSGELILTEGVSLSLRENVLANPGKDAAKLPAMQVRTENLRGVYAAGKYKLDFGGDLLLGERRIPFSVNNPVEHNGVQFSLQHFGFAPRLVVERSGHPIFDFFTNLRHADQGDYFPLEEVNGTRLFLILFPDYIREGRKIGSSSSLPNNPRLVVKVIQGEAEVAKGLLAPGESTQVGTYRISFPELRHWTGLSVTREKGLGLLMVGLILVITGLAARFFSNERRLTAEFAPVDDVSTLLRICGFSRYYPAFLEREVREIAEIVRHG